MTGRAPRAVFCPGCQSMVAASYVGTAAHAAEDRDG